MVVVLDVKDLNNLTEEERKDFDTLVKKAKGRTFADSLSAFAHAEAKYRVGNCIDKDPEDFTDKDKEICETVEGKMEEYLLYDENALNYDALDAIVQDVVNNS
jgi:hypothetical protein